MNQPDIRRRTSSIPLAYPIAAFLVTALLYLTTVTQLITQDSITYAAAAVRGGLASWLHPHHLIYNVLLAGVARLFGDPHDGDVALRSLQAFNAIASALAVAMFLVLLGRLAVPRARAALLTLVFATANGFWLYSTQIEVYNLAVLFGLVALWSYVVAVEQERPSIGVGIAGALAAALALLSHQTAIFLLFGFGVHGLFVARGAERLRRLATYVVAPLVIVGVLYLAAAWYVTGELGPSGVLRFATSYAHTGQWGGFSIKNFVKAPIGLVSGFVSVGEGIASYSPGAATARDLVGIALFLFGAVAVVIAVLRRSSEERLDRVERGLLVVLAAWVVAHAAFVWWWHPGNIEFWIIVVPPLLLAAAVAWPSSAEGTRVALAGLATVLVAQLVGNVPGVVEGMRSSSPRIVEARSVSALTTSSDLLLVTSHPGMIGYYQYYSTADLFFPFQASLGDDTAAIAAALDTLSRRVDAVRERGGRIVLEGDPMLVPGSSTPRSEIERRSIRQWLDRYSWRTTAIGGRRVLLLEPQTAGGARRAL